MAAIERADGRVILDGRLGCHVCGAQFSIAGGVASFSPAPPAELLAGADGGADPLRIAALLGLESASGVVVLEGGAASAADTLLEMLPVSVLAVNPTQPTPPRERFGAISTAAGIPLRTGVAAGVALVTSASTMDSARVLRVGGRLLAPTGAEVPAGLTQLARDEREWVAVKTGTGEAIQLTRR
ncbi:hypothetical protein BH23GEM2_BH23GEM2_08710 [soil metagenome]